MTIDERLEKLVDRHETLTQSVERMAFTMNRQETNLDRLETNLDRLEKVTAENASLIGVLARAVLRHEERLDRMEGNSAA